MTHELLKEIYNALQKAEISIPFPQLDVHIQKTSDRVQGAVGRGHDGVHIQ